jgi:hypothetical protein
MRWSLVLSALIAFQSALSFVCVALPISTQSDELERRAPARRPKRAPAHGPDLRISSEKYRENSKDHPYAYHVDNLGPKGKLRGNTKVRKDELTEAERRKHADEVLATHTKRRPIHAGMLLRNLRLQFLVLASYALIVDHVFEVQMINHHLKQHGIKFESVFTLILLRLGHPLIIFLFSEKKPEDAKTLEKVRGILNGPGNMALIPGSLNQSVRFFLILFANMNILHLTHFVSERPVD